MRRRAQPSTCADSKTLRSYASAGTCQGGNCSYVPTDTTCANGCSGGACAGDPCAGVTCSTPPASSCIAANTLRSYAPAGICASGTCSYSATSTTCSFGCSGGACLADPCAGITCTTPPAPTCVGASRRTYGATGTCSAGVCSYPATDTACTAPASGTTGTCAAGACGYTCNAGLSSCGGACVDLGTNPKNCGVCGHDCLGGACAAGSCQALTLASGEESPWGIALDDTSVYFTNFGGGTIRKVPKAGGSTVTLASGSAPSGIAIVPPGGVLAAGSVVWTESNGGVYTVPASGGARVAIQPEVSAGSNPKGFPAGLAVDASNVYWVDNAHATVYRAPLAGGPRTALSDPYVQPLGLYLSGGEVFWTQYGASGTIRKAPIAGGPSQVLTPAGAPNASSVFVDGFDVFFATFNDVSRVSTVGGAASVLASPGASPGAVAADASNVYFLQNDGYELWRMPRAGGAATRLFEDSSIAGSCNVYAGAWVRPNLVVDKDAIYWAHCGAGGRVLKLAK